MGASTSASEALSSSSFTSSSGKTKAAFTKHNGFGHFQTQANGNSPDNTNGGATTNGKATNGVKLSNGKSIGVSPNNKNKKNGSNNNNKNNNGNKNPRITEINGSFESDHIVAADFVADTKLPTDVGQFQLRAYRVHQNSNDGEYEPYENTNALEPVVIYSSDKPPFGKDGKLAENVPIRVHDQCLTSEVFRSRRYVVSKKWCCFTWLAGRCGEVALHTTYP